ncbi:nitroreductase family protein [Fusobacterium sp. MFO224]|uniref:nitroreductase family protein n=1 Tax=Fusobacterium sp. MFO224 TaxID=3378070 RepID=UPI003854C9C6
MNFLGKRTIRKFKDIAIEQDKLDEIIKTALKAPSGQGKDPCEFVIFNTKEKIEKLVGIKPHGGSCLKTATAVIAVLVNKDKAYTPVEDGSVATHTIGLKAYDLGVASCWVHIIGRQASDTETSEEFFKKVVSIPDNLMVFSLVALGYADEEKSGYTDEDLDFSKVHYCE